MTRNAGERELPLLRGLAPVLPGGRIAALVLGSFPSVASLASGQYYAHPQNRFWRVLAHCGVVEDPDAPYAERIAAVRRRGVAIWDLYGRVRRQGSGDDRIRDAVPNAIGALLAGRGPFPVLLNGRRLREWRRHFGALPAEVAELPSTSPRPLHWNTPESRAAALGEWCAALRSAGSRAAESASATRSRRAASASRRARSAPSARPGRRRPACER